MCYCRYCVSSVARDTKNIHGFVTKLMGSVYTGASHEQLHPISIRYASIVFLMIGWYRYRQMWIFTKWLHVKTRKINDIILYIWLTFIYHLNGVKRRVSPDGVNCRSSFRVIIAVLFSSTKDKKCSSTTLFHWRKLNGN